MMISSPFPKNLGHGCTAAVRVFLALLLLGVTGLLSPSAKAVTYTWSTAPTSSNFNTATDWTNNAVPVTGNPWAFTNSTITGLNNDLTTSAFSVTGITFNSNANAFTISGNAFTLNGAIANNSKNVQTINDAIILGASETITPTVGGGNIILNGAITGATFGLTIAAAESPISGVPNVISAGSVVLGGSNTFTGNITNNGSLVLANGYALGNGTSSNVSTVQMATAGAILTFASDTALVNSNLTISNSVAGGSWWNIVLDRGSVGAGMT
ncbi:MAG: hypothetical protein WCP60_11410, partial [bacterium]